MKSQNIVDHLGGRSHQDSVNQFKVARKSDTGRFRVWELRFLKEGQKIFLKGLDTKGAIAICNEVHSKMEILVECSRSMQVEKLLRDRDITFEILPSDSIANNSLQKLRLPRSHRYYMPCATLKKKDKSFIDWDDYYPLSSIYSWMDQIEKLYPATCTTSTIGKSIEGRPIKTLKISNSNASNTGVWIDGCMHAREWISVAAVTFIADYIAVNFNKLPPYITNKDWYFTPVINPDGYHHTHTIDRLWRKNRARFGNTIVGVDLNRNFGHNWGQCGTEAVPIGDPMHQNYRGLEAFSEPESSAVKDLILYSGTPFKIFLSFHAFSELISFPWCNTSDPCADYVNLLEGGACMAKAIYDTSGKLYKVGNFKDVMYYASGTSIDWSYGTAKIPFSYLMELRGKEHKFELPKDQIRECCKESAAAVLALAEFVENRTCLNCKVLSARRAL